MRNATKHLTLTLAASVFAIVSAGSASATEGYFQNGLGARSKALAGAGVANGADATSAALNPAGIIHADTEADISVSVFAPFREFTTSGPPAGLSALPFGTIESDRNYFAIPNMAVNWKTPDNPYFDAFALSMAGNGGMNTSYASSVATALNSPCPGFGIFCGGKAGVDLQQMLISAAMAKQFGNISVGIAPTAAVQIFSDRGVGAFAPFSIDGANFSNNGYNYKFGLGLRGGIEWAVMPGLRFGVTGSTPIWMQKMEKYRGLFAEQGGFDIPANIQAGIAIDINPALTLMVDWRHIWYSGTDSINNSIFNFLLAGQPFGGSAGPGFGWRDVDTIKVGVEWQATSDLTLRAGYSYNTQPIPNVEVNLNVLAPGVVQHHITGGFGYKWSDNIELEFAGMYAPRVHVVGPDLFAGGARTIDVNMEQFEATFGVKYKFGSE